MADETVYVIIPAGPGYEVLEYYHNEGGTDACIDRQPVVAWRIDPADGSDYAEPITPDTNNKRFECVIKYPDGRVNWPACQTWDTEALWLVDAEARGEQQRKHKLKLV
jgi:hypothetical protein